MKKILVINIILFNLISNCYSQNWLLGVGAGAWFHSQNTLKKFNESVKSSIPFDTEITDNFPSTAFFKCEAGYESEQLYCGVTYTYNSTGSRITSTDYSGSYHYDVILSGNLAGLTLGFYRSINNKMKFYYKGEVGGIFSSLTMKESIILKNIDSKEDKIDLVATSIYTKPILQLSYELSKLKFNLSVGYLIDFKSSFHVKNQNNSKLINSYTNEEVKTNWNGFNVGLCINYTFCSR